MAQISNEIDREWLSANGLSKVNNIYWNLNAAELVEHAVSIKEGKLSQNGSLVVQTGVFTGRSPKDKYFVNEPSSFKDIWWGSVNQQLSENSFDKLYTRVISYLSEKNIYVQDLFGGADINYRLPVRVVTEYAWHSLFSRQLLVRPDMYATESSDAPMPGTLDPFTIICVPGCLAIPEEDNVGSSTFIVINPGKRIVLIGGTEYAGEIKKSVFTVLNYLLPKSGILPMHCSANVSDNGDTTLFFGLSGTGKTTLSADPARDLIGDDEHGWSSTGVYNFEGGCYAKCIHLRKESEPEIWNAIQFGSVLENVVMDRSNRALDFECDALTENTRAAYPIDFIQRSRIPGVGGHPKNIIFLTADAFGVLPPISKLTHEQAKYHFLNGYTAKIAGTERGLGKEPQATFSACFGLPFLPLHPEVYANMLSELLIKHSAKVWLVNTGWSGGGYGVGKRISLEYTRRMIAAVLDSELESVEYVTDPYFGLMSPKSIQGIPDQILNAKSTWADQSEYDIAAGKLASLFQENYKKYTEYQRSNISAAA